jgi:hypothetical protein
MDMTGMRALLRRDLRDEDETALRWSDDELDRHISRAVREFSGALPLEADCLLGTVPGSREMDISGITDLVTVDAVEYPADRFPRCFCRFSLRGDTVTLLGTVPPDGSAARIYYTALHNLDASSSTVPSSCEDLIAAGAAGHAALSWALFAVNRINAGGPEAPGELLAWGTGRLDFFRRELARLGRKNRVRTSSLYRAALPPVSRTSDDGPGGEA